MKKRAILQGVKQVICIGMVILVLLPILLTLFAAFKTKGDMVKTSPLLLPPIGRITFENFAKVLKDLNSQKFSQLISKSISSCLAGICLLEIIFVMVNRSCSAIKRNKWIWRYFIILASDIT